MKKLATFLFITLLSVSNAVYSKTVTERAAKDQVSYVSNDDPAMAKAYEKAKATLDSFLLLAQSPPLNTTAFSVKVGIREGKHTEYFWISDITQSGNQLQGRINNEPELVKSVKNGQMYSFAKSKIVDWTYRDRTKHRTFGNFTACALLSKEPANEDEEFKKQYGLECN